MLRFSYATDPGLARPGWFIDDVKVTATTPDGDEVLLETDFESDGGPDDPRVFNGGCQDDFGSDCTQGWSYVNADAEAPADHAYYLELRDRSGFDLDGKGENDRDPIEFEPGLSMVYTDEAHGYGNVGTDNPPAQSPLDSQPEPGSDTPDLSDAAWTDAAGDKAFSDSGQGHTDNYTDPAETEPDPRFPDVDTPWRFQYDCLSFLVTSMVGKDVGPVASDGNLAGSVDFDLGRGLRRLRLRLRGRRRRPRAAGQHRAGRQGADQRRGGAHQGGAPARRARLRRRRDAERPAVLLGLRRRRHDQGLHGRPADALLRQGRPLHGQADRDRPQRRDGHRHRAGPGAPAGPLPGLAGHEVRLVAHPPEHRALRAATSAPPPARAPCA